MYESSVSSQSHNSVHTIRTALRRTTRSLSSFLGRDSAASGCRTIGRQNQRNLPKPLTEHDLTRQTASLNLALSPGTPPHLREPRLPPAICLVRADAVVSSSSTAICFGTDVISQNDARRSRFTESGPRHGDLRIPAEIAPFSKPQRRPFRPAFAPVTQQQRSSLYAK